MDIAARSTSALPTVEALYRADAGRLWRSLSAWSGDPDLASDAVAEAYAQLLNRGDAVRDPAAWTWRAAFRIAGGALKARRERSEPLAVDDVHHDQYADHDLHAALRRLPDGQRAALILFYFADLPAGEIAKRLASNQLAVRANLSRGRRRLRELLGERDG